MTDYAALVREAREALVGTTPGTWNDRILIWGSDEDKSLMCTTGGSNGLVKRLADALEETQKQLEVAVEVAAAFRCALDHPGPLPPMPPTMADYRAGLDDVLRDAQQRGWIADSFEWRPDDSVFQEVLPDGRVRQVRTCNLSSEHTGGLITGKFE